MTLVRRTVALLALFSGVMFGAQVPATGAGSVFEDTKGNGRRDAGERGIAGVAVSNQREVV